MRNLTAVAYNIAQGSMRLLSERMSWCADHYESNLNTSYK